MTDEPRRHRLYLLLLGLTALGTAPLPFAGRETVLFAGIPLWLWWSFSFTVALSLLTAWGILRFWRSPELDREPPAGELSDGGASKDGHSG